jgi:hypothetical protein
MASYDVSTIYLALIRGLTQQMKLKNLVIDSYIPPDELQKLTQHAVFDDREETWRVAGRLQSSPFLLNCSICE